MARFNALRRLIDYMAPENSIGVEIGVHHAQTSVYMLDNSKKLGHLYCIDPYFKRKGRSKTTKAMLGKYDNCTFLHMTSHEASSVVPDNLDWIFIDGDHSYAAVLQDLEDWVPKIRSGGLMSGHDWTSLRGIEVPKAGVEYLLKNGHLFEPLMSQKELIKMKLPYRIGGQGLIHKQKGTGWPIWWRIKK